MPRQSKQRARHAGALPATLFLFVLFGLPATIFAQTTPLIFARESITITSKTPALPAPATPQESFERAPNNQTAQPEPTAPAAVNAAPPAFTQHRFNVEVRPEDALKLDYIHALTALRADSGVMIAFSAPTIAPLPYFRIQQATDVLFISNEGVVLQIYPGHVPIQITQEIYAERPIKALLYLKAGTVQARNIRPQDVVQSRTFSPPPPLLQ